MSGVFFSIIKNRQKKNPDLFDFIISKTPKSRIHENFIAFNQMDSLSEIQRQLWRVRICSTAWAIVIVFIYWKFNILYKHVLCNLTKSTCAIGYFNVFFFKIINLVHITKMLAKHWGIQLYLLISHSHENEVKWKKKIHVYSRFKLNAKPVLIPNSLVHGIWEFWQKTGLAPVF